MKAPKSILMFSLALCALTCTSVRAETGTPAVNPAVAQDVAVMNDELLRLKTRKYDLIAQADECRTQVEASDAFVQVSQESAQAEDALEVLENEMQAESSEMTDEDYVTRSDELNARLQRAQEIRDQLYHDSTCPLIEGQIQAIEDQERALSGLIYNRLAPGEIQQQIRETRSRAGFYHVD